MSREKNRLFSFNFSVSEREFELINLEVRKSGLGRREFFAGALENYIERGEDKFKSDMAELDAAISAGLSKTSEKENPRDGVARFMRVFEISDTVLDDLAKVFLGGGYADGDASF